jgi:diaminohydroxyphosphoribosylaminopyrimidine deaminase/5-amino-6-(5-phosphoribosylamino)uracil reductase
MEEHELHMQRCIQLAKMGNGFVAPNPLVGSVLIYQGIILGEGWHREYGKEHAEVNCIRSVSEQNRELIPLATLYVSLEPCSHVGKTPPCTALIIQNNIKKVVIGCTDTSEKVNGSGIQILQEAGIQVITNVLEKECRELNKRFFTFHEKRRPYIILKWAQSKNECIARNDSTRIFISGEESNRLVQTWRSEESAIMVGHHTALLDDPALTNRSGRGKNPVRIIIDKQLTIPVTHHVYDGCSVTYIFNELKEEVRDHIHFIKLPWSQNVLPVLLHHLYGHHILSVLVEGGTILAQSFIDLHMWDEARVITNEGLEIPGGYAAPRLTDALLVNTEHLGADKIDYFRPKQSRI